MQRKKRHRKTGLSIFSLGRSTETFLFAVVAGFASLREFYSSLAKDAENAKEKRHRKTGFKPVLQKHSCSPSLRALRLCENLIIYQMFNLHNLNILSSYFLHIFRLDSNQLLT